MRMQTSTRWYDSLVLVAGLLCFFTLLLGSYALGVPDEGRYGEIPREMLVHGQYLTPHLDGILYFEKPILFYWLGVAAIKFFGLNQFAVRLPTALFAVLGCCLVYLAARYLYGRRAGILSALVLASSVLYFVLAHVATPDMTVSICLTGTLLCFLLSTHATKPRWLMYGAYCFAALAVLTKGLMGVAFPVLIIGLWIVGLQQWSTLKRLYLPTGILLFLALAAPWHILVQIANPEFFHFYFIDQQFLRYLTMTADRYKPDWFFVPILLLGFMPWTIFLPGAIKQHLPTKWQDRQQYRDGLFFILWAVIIFLFFSFSKSKLITYILPVLPPLAIMVGHYLATQWEQKRANKQLAWEYASLVVMAFLLGVASMIALWHLPAMIPQPISFIASILCWVAGAIVAAVVWFKYQDVAKALPMLIAGVVLGLLLLLPAMSTVDLGSVKSLALTLKPILGPHDEVAVYNQYYQDLPFYLQRRIAVVNSVGELKFGMQHQDVSSWMIDNTVFAQQWHSAQRIFVVLGRNSLASFKQAIHGDYYLLAQTPSDMLLVNQPVKNTWVKNIYDY